MTSSRVGIAVRVAGEREARKAVVATRREEHERVPASAPRSADRTGGVEDREASSLFRQEVPHGESRLTSAYHCDLESIVRAVNHLRLSCRRSLLRSAAPTQAGGRVSRNDCPASVVPNIAETPTDPLPFTSSALGAVALDCHRAARLRPRRCPAQARRASGSRRSPELHGRARRSREPPP